MRAPRCCIEEASIGIREKLVLICSAAVVDIIGSLVATSLSGPKKGKENMAKSIGTLPEIQ
jgi:hypothetical protein